MRIVPRPYQERAITSSLRFLFEAKQRSGLVLMPTGVGKSIVIADVVRQTKLYYPPARILMLTHVKELVEQNHEKAQSMIDQHVGVWSAGLRKKEFSADILFAGIDTVANNPSELGRRDIILIDEAHRVAPSPTTNYQQVTQHLLNYNPHLKVLGLTATGYRMGQGMLTNAWTDTKTKERHAAYWQTIIEDMTSLEEFNQFFSEGYLKRIVPNPPETEIDVSKMRIRNGEYVQGDVEIEVNNEAKIRAIVDEICEKGFDRRSWMVFSAGNYNAELLTREIASRGISVACITDSTPAAERRRAIALFKEYKIRCIVNNGILTTGFDHAGVDLIAVVRVTNSTPLWVQILGRGTRPVYASGYDLNTKEGRLAAIFASGVYNCLVLDFAGNAKRLGAINAPVIPLPPEERKRKMVGECPVKVCKACGIQNPTQAAICENCGAEFLLSESITDTAGTTQLIQEVHVPDIRKFLVTSQAFKLHSTILPDGSTVSSVYARYNYKDNGKFANYSERLSFSGETSTRATKQWWQAFGDGTPIPTSNQAFIDYYSVSRIKRLRVIEIYMNNPKKSRPEATFYGFGDYSYSEIEQEDVAYGT